ncbi:hypothetical protein [Reinekea marinisedimentorum]|uniref:Leucine rich repeat (LRR) protein n=1 Tax=Reinekea marinisedimentorum TaxID=230495 RepID=A0A4R3HRR5_9GAMM|nr:hypothetical protein [Reinekea marinisedimentorum]TCS35672.1 hypothetical protein BCF53_1331 [Reinekea marinisedimentorum]
MNEIYPYSGKVTRCNTGEVTLDEHFDLRLSEVASTSQLKLIDLSKKNMGVYWAPTLPIEWKDLSQTEKSELVANKEFEIEVEAIYCRSEIGLVELKEIVQFNEIKRLHIHQSTLSNDDLRYLKGLVHLNCLLLRGMQFTDECIKYLCGCRSLSILDVFETSIGVEGEMNLKKHLPACEIYSSNTC